MSKFNELTILAESAPTGPWVAENDSLYFDDDGYTRHLLDADAGHDVTEKDYCAALKFIAAANPKVVMELIAEVERLRTAEGDAMTYKAGMENCAAQRDEAKADNDLLRAEINHLISSPLYSTRMNSKRYLWLRDSHIGDDPESINLECGPNKGINSAIDAAMSKGN